MRGTIKQKKARVASRVYRFGPAGTSDMSSALQAWLATVPDSAIIRFAHANQYQSSGVLTLSGRNNLDIDGNGATLRAPRCYDPALGGTPGTHAPETETGSHEARRQLIVSGGSNLRFRDLRFLGAGRPWKGTAQGQGHGTAMEATWNMGGWTGSNDATVIVVIAVAAAGSTTTISAPTLWDERVQPHVAELDTTAWTEITALRSDDANGLQIRAYRWDGDATTVDIGDNPASAETAPTAVNGSESGGVDAGLHKYKVVAMTYRAGEETACGPTKQLTVTTGGHDVKLGAFGGGDAMPSWNNLGAQQDAWVPFRRVYRTKASDPNTFYKVADIGNQNTHFTITSGHVTNTTTHEATITTSTAHDFTTADQVTEGWKLQILSAGTGWTGTWVVTSVPDSTHVNVLLATNPADTSTGEIQRARSQYIDRVPDASLGPEIYTGVNNTVAATVSATLGAAKDWAMALMAFKQPPDVISSSTTTHAAATTATFGDMTRTTDHAMALQVIATKGLATFGDCADGSATNFYTRGLNQMGNAGVSLGAFIRNVETPDEDLSGQVALGASLPYATFSLLIPFPFAPGQDLRHQYHHGITPQSTTGTTVEDCDFLWQYGPGIQSESGSSFAPINQIWRRCRFMLTHFQATSSSGVAGGSIDHCTYYRIGSNEAHDAEPTSTSAGVTDWSMTDNTLSVVQKLLISIAGNLGAPLRNVVVSRNTQIADEPGQGIKLALGSGGAMVAPRQQILIEDNELWVESTSSGGAISIFGGAFPYRNVLIRNNIIHVSGSSRAYAVQLSNCDEITIQGNTFYGSNTTSLIRDSGGNTNIHDAGDNVWGVAEPVYSSSNWPSTSWRLFSPGSVWNQTLDRSRFDPNSATYIASLMADGAPPDNTATVRQNFGFPLYFGTSSDPLYTIDLTQTFTSYEQEINGLQVRCPSAAQPSSGTDSVFRLIDQTTTPVWMYHFQDASIDTVNHVITAGRSYRLDAHGNGFHDPTEPPTGLLPLRPEELASGYVNHTIGLHAKCLSGHPVAPYDTSLTHGVTCLPGDETTRLSMGHIITTDLEESDIAALSIPTYQKAILRALSFHGALVGFNGSASWTLTYEAPQDRTAFGLPEPYAAAGLPATLVLSNALDSIGGWGAHLRVLAPFDR